jgi:YwiC-like protein
MQSAIAPSPKPNPQAWYRPTFSPEHGVYVMLAVSFLTGAAAAQQWTWTTTLAAIGAFCGFQAEHPWVLQIKQRKSWKPRFLVWGSVYGLVAGAIALFLLWQTNQGKTTQGEISLWWLYGGAIAAFLFNAVSVWHRQQKSILNELVTFAAICLAAPFAYGVTVGTISTEAIALWLLNTLFFSSAIFTVKLRKTKTASVIPGVIFHAVAIAIVLELGFIGWLLPVTASAFAVVLLKFAGIVWQQDWYRHTSIGRVAMLETGAALAFLAIAALSVLPTHLKI